MENLPLYVPVVFGISVLAALYIFYRAADHSKGFLGLAIAWIVLQTIISLTRFYTVQTKPPRFILLTVPPVLFAIIYSSTRPGKVFLSKINLKVLALIHTVRIPVELVLLWLFVYHAVPRAMTFEGRNFDIFSGVTAPLIYYFGFVKKTLSRQIIIIWNFICLGLLLNVLIIGASSAITGDPMAGTVKTGIAIQYFPFVLLPGFLVLIILFSHVVSIGLLLKTKEV
jgi:hypothetical protein